MKKTATYGICKVCGCSMNNPCYNPKHGFCWWNDECETICSHCADETIKNDKETVHCVNDVPNWEAPKFFDKDGFEFDSLKELETIQEGSIICPCCGHKPDTEDYSLILSEGKNECPNCGCVYEAVSEFRYSTTCVSYRTDGKES